jgi:hypothetical protein
MTDKKEFSFGKAPFSGSFFTDGKVLGSILAYDDATQTYRVQTEGNKRKPSDRGQFLVGVPRKQAHSGDCAVLAPQTTVIVDYGLGFPYIDGVLPKSSSTSAVAGVAPDFGAAGGSGAEKADTGGNYRQLNTPRGMLPGDQVLSGEDGNYIAALRGKETVLYGSERAQVIAFGLHDLVRSVCENYEHFSSIGNLQITNKDGRANLSFRAGSDQASQSGGELENWTFRLDIGAEGQLFNMRVTSPDNSKTYAQIKMSPDGFLEISGMSARADTTAGDRYTTTGGKHFVRTTGDTQEVIEGAITRDITGAETESIGSTRQATIGMDEVVSVNRNEVKSLGGQQITTVMGGIPLDAKPTNKAKEVHVVNGSYVIEVGSPKDGGIPSAMSGYKVYTYNGAVILGENPMLPATVCSVNLNTLKPNSIGLGCIVPGPWPEAALNPPTGSAMMYEKWLILFNTMVTLLDSHTHTTAWGPSGPAMAPAPVGFQTALSGLTAAVKSLRVMIGA